MWSCQQVTTGDNNRFRVNFFVKTSILYYWICFILMIVRSNPPQVFTLKLLVSLVFLGYHIVVLFIFHYFA